MVNSEWKVDEGENRNQMLQFVKNVIKLAKNILQGYLNIRIKTIKK